MTVRPTGREEAKALVAVLCGAPKAVGDESEGEIWRDVENLDGSLLVYFR